MTEDPPRYDRDGDNDPAAFDRLAGFDGDVVVADENTRCDNCAHFTVCKWFPAFKKLLTPDDPDEAAEIEPPIPTPFLLAVICDEFEPVET